MRLSNRGVLLAAWACSLQACEQRSSALPNRLATRLCSTKQGSRQRILSRRVLPSPKLKPHRSGQDLDRRTLAGGGCSFDSLTHAGGAWAVPTGFHHSLLSGTWLTSPCATTGCAASHASYCTAPVCNDWTCPTTTSLYSQETWAIFNN